MPRRKQCSSISKLFKDLHWVCLTISLEDLKTTNIGALPAYLVSNRCHSVCTTAGSMANISAATHFPLSASPFSDDRKRLLISCGVSLQVGTCRAGRTSPYLVRRESRCAAHGLPSVNAVPEALRRFCLVSRHIGRQLRKRYNAASFPYCCNSFALF